MDIQIDIYLKSGYSKTIFMDIFLDRWISFETFKWISMNLDILKQFPWISLYLHGYLSRYQNGYSLPQNKYLEQYPFLFWIFFWDIPDAADSSRPCGLPDCFAMLPINHLFWILVCAFRLQQWLASISRNLCQI